MFGHIGTRVAELEKVMRAEEFRNDMLRTLASKITYHEARAAYLKQLAIDCEFWRQKSRVKWIQVGDVNTTFFHAVVRQRRASNYLARLRSSTRKWRTRIEDIKCSATAFFETLFSSDKDTDRHPVLPFCLPRVSLGNNEGLLALPSMEEVREVVFSISPDSALGPDGFGSGFY